MLQNVNYNLLEEITQKSQSLYRYDRYIQDAQAQTPPCLECIKLWQEMKEHDEEDLSHLMQHFKAHIDAGMVDFGLHVKRAA